MKREDIKNLLPDITKEQLDSIMEMNGKDIEKAKADFSDYEDIKSQLAEKDKIISAREQDISDLKKLDAEGLKNKISEMENKYKDEKKTWEKNLADLKKNSAIKLALGDSVQDVDIVLGLLEGEKITLDEKGTLTGLDDQIKTLKESKGFLFKDNNNGLGGIKPREGSEQGSSGVEMAQARAIMGLAPLK